MSGDFGQFWKDDFHCLQHQSKILNECLRKDELLADLNDRIETGHKGQTHLYFPDAEEPPSLRYVRTHAIPLEIRNAIKNNHSETIRMGLAAHARIAWIIVDCSVYLWSFEKRSDAFIRVDTPNRQYIHVVGVVPPNYAIFDDSVKWCLVTTTTKRVYLSALQYLDDDGMNALPHGPRGVLVHEETDMSVSTDNIQCTAVAGTPDGRIFLGGEQGHMMEIQYFKEGVNHDSGSNRLIDELNEFYDGDREILSKVSDPNSFFAGIKRVAGSDNMGKRKCRRVDVTPNYLSAVFPRFILKAFPHIEGHITQLIMDEHRNQLYGLTEQGSVMAWSIGNGKRLTTFIGSFKVEETAVLYLQRVSRGQYNTSPTIRFLGGMASAQAGVGGSEGARSILKANEDRRTSANPVKPLAPRNIHVIPPTESRVLSMVITTAGGLRLFSSAALQQGLKLHHIRAAAPAIDSHVYEDDVKGIKPARALVGSVGVGASCHYNGIFVAAPTEFVRDVIKQRAVTSIVVASRDERYKEVVNNEGKPVRRKLGGIIESISWPRGNDALPGGIVHDIAPIPPTSKLTDYLLVHSKTPSDSELSRSLTPAFSPKSASNNKASNRDNTLAMPTNPLLLFGAYVTSVLFGTQLRPASVPRREHFRRFRVSQRDPSKGYSFTAAEKKSRYLSSTRTKSTLGKNTSVRVPEFLLHPDVKPVRDLATQCFQAPVEIVALNMGGAHFFAHDTILTRLTDALATPEEISGNSLSSYFDSYGTDEGCSLCLSLAMGIGPAASLTFVQERARRAVFKRGCSPSLRPIQTTNGALSGSVFTHADDDAVPEGYEFHPSFLCRGLTSLAARLVRPIWHKPIVVVTEGQTITQNFGKSTHSPAKVELLLDITGVEELLSPLSKYEATVLDMFSRAINTVPGSTQATPMDTEEVDSHLLTGLQQHNRNLLPTSSLKMNLSEYDRKQLACLLEEKSIHSLYRLIARLTQLLRLLGYLMRAHADDNICEANEINWGLLHGLTTAQLVQTPEGQDRLEIVLNELLMESASRGPQTSSVATDNFATLLEKDCFFFFSPASRNAYKGFRIAAEALSNPRTRSEFNDAVLQVRECFIVAASNWYNASMVICQSGRHGNFQNSVLVEAAATLMRLKDAVGCVQVCFAAASNFQKKKAHDNVGILRVHSIVPVGEKLPWESGLYHKRRESTSGVQRQTNFRSTIGNSRSPSTTQSTSTTPRDVVDACYKVIFHKLSELLTSGEEDRELGARMLSMCLSSTDESFFEALFSFLSDHDFKEYLFSIENCNRLEEWLKARESAADLYDYYTAQDRHKDAGEFAYNVGRNSTTSVHLSNRIAWLERALTSFENVPKDPIYTEDPRVEEVRTKLRTAKIQQRIANKLKNSNNIFGDRSPDANELERLETTLVPVDDLFNNIASEFCLNEECLYLLHTCRTYSKDTIEQLWMNILCVEVLPCATINRNTFSNLMKFASEADARDQIKFLHPGDRDALELFESFPWVQKLHGKIVELGRDLFGTGADFVFPVDFLLAKLEDLRRSHRTDVASTMVRAPSPGWSLVTLADSGVPYMKIWDCYNAVSPDRFLLDGPDVEGMIESIGSIFELVEVWLSRASTDGPAREELVTAKNLGNLHSKITALKTKLEGIPFPARQRLASRLDAIEEHASESPNYFG